MDLKVKILKKPEVTELAGEKVMIDFESGKYFMLKGSANAIWDLLEDGIKISEITDKLRQEYEVEENVCRKSVEEFLETLVQKGFLTLM